MREVVLVHEDVTDTRAGEEKLRLSEERLQRALAAGGMNVWDWDLVRGTVECSDNARDFWGIDVGSARATSAPSFILTITLCWMMPRAQRFEGDGNYDAEYRLVDAAGQKPMGTEPRTR